jgi:hypothetical protein
MGAWSPWENASYCWAAQLTRFVIHLHVDGRMCLPLASCEALPDTFSSLLPQEGHCVLPLAKQINDRAWIGELVLVVVSLAGILYFAFVR